jgi:hypothetical protein
VEIHDAKSHDIIVQQHGAMTLDVVLLYNNTMSFGPVLGVYFWDFPQGLNVEILQKIGQNAKISTAGVHCRPLPRPRDR